MPQPVLLAFLEQGLEKEDLQKMCESGIRDYQLNFEGMRYCHLIGREDMVSCSYLGELQRLTIHRPNKDITVNIYSCLRE